jgi:cyclophilin family peptidyl-prolyl cis-trans isomerase
MRLVFTMLICSFILGACSTVPSVPKPFGVQREYPWGPTVAPVRPLVIMETNRGEIMVELFPKFTPETVKNFLRYVDEGFYDQTIFHRILRDVCLQGGGFDTEGKHKEPHDPIAYEFNEAAMNVRGSIAVARANDPDSGSSQFFINIRRTKGYDESDQSHGYVVFGRVVRGMEIVDDVVKNSAIREDREDWPVEPLVILRAYQKR